MIGESGSFLFLSCSGAPTSLCSDASTRILTQRTVTACIGLTRTDATHQNTDSEAHRDNARCLEGYCGDPEEHRPRAFGVSRDEPRETTSFLSLQVRRLNYIRRH